MTINSTVNKVVANGNGAATSFSFSPMTIFEDTDMTVTLIDNLGNETLLTEGTGATNYAVVVASYPGTGSITYPATGGTPLPSGWQIAMKPVLPLTQEMALSTQGPYAPDTQMAAFDRQTVIAQQQQEQLDRSVVLPIGVTGVSTQLPVPVANTVLAWASNALSLINVGIASIGQTVASAFSLTLFLLTTAAAWRTALGSTTVGDAVFSAASASAARTALGSTTVGDAVFTAASAAAARTATGAGTVTSVATAGLATGGTFTGSGTITVTASSKAQAQAGTDTTTAMTPAMAIQGPGAVKAHGVVASNTLTESYNIASVTHSGTGVYAIAFTTNLASGNFAVNVSPGSIGRVVYADLSTRSASGVTIKVVGSDFSTAADGDFSFSVLGLF